MTLFSVWWNNYSVPQWNQVPRCQDWQDAELIAEDVSMERSHCRVSRHVRTDMNEGSADMNI